MNRSIENLGSARLTGGSKETPEFATAAGKPWIHLPRTALRGAAGTLEISHCPSHRDFERGWVARFEAGICPSFRFAPSRIPEIYKFTKEILETGAVAAERGSVVNRELIKARSAHGRTISPARTLPHSLGVHRRSNNQSQHPFSPISARPPTDHHNPRRRDVRTTAGNRAFLSYFCFLPSVSYRFWKPFRRGEPGE